jgi:hypothetical protein
LGFTQTSLHTARTCICAGPLGVRVRLQPLHVAVLDFLSDRFLVWQSVLCKHYKCVLPCRTPLVHVCGCGCSRCYRMLRPACCSLTPPPCSASPAPWGSPGVCHCCRCRQQHSHVSEGGSLAAIGTSIVVNGGSVTGMTDMPKRQLMQFKWAPVTCDTIQKRIRDSQRHGTFSSAIWGSHVGANSCAPTPAAAAAGLQSLTNSLLVSRLYGCRPVTGAGAGQPPCFMNLMSNQEEPCCQTAFCTTASHM